MPQYPVQITQVFRTERKITIKVEAEDLASAVENVASGAVDTPPHDDPRWLTGWDLQNEVVEPGKPEDVTDANGALWRQFWDLENRLGYYSLDGVSIDDLKLALADDDGMDGGDVPEIPDFDPGRAHRCLQYAKNKMDPDGEFRALVAEYAARLYRAEEQEGSTDDG